RLDCLQVFVRLRGIGVLERLERQTDAQPLQRLAEKSKLRRVERGSVKEVLRVEVVRGRLHLLEQPPYIGGADRLQMLHQREEVVLEDGHIEAALQRPGDEAHQL